MQQPHRFGGLNRAPKKLKPQSAIPWSKINEMLIYLGSTAVCKLLKIFSHSWKQGKLPQILQETIMILILKKKEIPEKANSHCPVSLTCCVVRTLERMVKEPLRGCLATADPFAPGQAGILQFHCTQDQVTYLAQETGDAFQEQKLVLVSWINFWRVFKNA